MAIRLSREPDGDDPGGMVTIAITADGEMASRWAEALRDAGIEAEVRIGDARSLTPSSTLASVGGSVGALFAYPVCVPPASRDEAASVLIELGWDGRQGERAPGPGAGVALRGALIALAAGAVVVLFVATRLLGEG